MVFNSLIFICFATIFYGIWPVLRKSNSTRWIWITAMSLIFYGWWDWRFLFLIIGSGLLDYLCGLGMVAYPRIRKWLLGISLIGNLGSLAIFKYSLFIARVFDDLCAVIGISPMFVDSLPPFTIILPVGISFYTFQSLSYTIDVYRGELKPVKNILHFFSFLTMFPQLVAGPIIRAKDLLRQLNEHRTVNALMLWHGVKLMAYGMFQKVVIADNLAYIIDLAYGGMAQQTGSLFWWLVTIGFAFQIYCDFSGYSLIARGLAKCMGYHFKMNFNHPYLAVSVKDFWSRWHISLSTWFRDYVYIPLGGSRKGKWFGILAMWITMLLSGIWHGANYTFIVWASLHAGYITVERLTTWPKRIHPYLGILITFFLAQIAWIYFRSESISQGGWVVSKLFNFSPETYSGPITEQYANYIIALLLAIGVEFAVFFIRENARLRRFVASWNADVLAVVLAISFSVWLRGEGQQFIYFQF